MPPGSGLAERHSCQGQQPLLFLAENAVAIEQRFQLAAADGTHTRLDARDLGDVALQDLGDFFHGQPELLAEMAQGGADEPALRRTPGTRQPGHPVRFVPPRHIQQLF